MRITCLLALLLVLSGCSRYYYSPNTHNVPLFKEKGEIKASAIASVGDEFEALEVQAAYSPVQNFGVMANFIGGRGGSDGKRSGRGMLGEVAAGYYRHLGSNIVAEIYGGAGYANIEHTYGAGMDYTTNIMTTPGKVDMTMVRGFIQPNLGIGTSYFDIALSARMCMFRFNGVQLSPGTMFSLDDYYELSAVVGRNYKTVEPALTLRGGWDYIKIQTQLTILTYGETSLRMNTTLLSAGIYISLHPNLFKRR